MKKRLLAMVLALVVMNVTLWAQSGYCGDPDVNGGMDVKWTFADGVLTIGGVGAMADYGHKGASWGSYEVGKVEISEGVTSIGASAFEGCTGLTGIVIPASVTDIGDWAFAKCYALTDIDIPPSVTSIGDKAFAKCTTLTVVDIPHSVTSIGNSVFSECVSLTSITLPASVTSIGDYAFEGCFALRDVTLPASVASFGTYAFFCPSLSVVICMNPVPPTLGGAAFDGISESAVLHVPDVEAYRASDWAKYFSRIEQMASTAVTGVVTGNTAAPIVHDLSGRRVSAPVEGRIYVVNDKATVW